MVATVGGIAVILVTVELVPASGGPKRHLGTAKIVNDGTGSVMVGNYNAMLSTRGQPNRVWRRGRVERFLRQKRNAWELLYEVLKTVIGEGVAPVTDKGIIYSLSDPGSLEIRYVGKTTKTALVRLQLHRKHARDGVTHLHQWLKSLGRPPFFSLLEEVALGKLDVAERRWIKSLRKDGCRLTNFTDGGTGGDTWRGRKMSSEGRAKISAALRGRLKSEEHKAKLRKPKSLTHRLNLSIAAQRRWAKVDRKEWGRRIRERLARK